MSKLFGSILKELRIKKGLYQNELAFEFNVSRPTVVKWENGTNEPSIDMICRIAEYFNTTTDTLLGMDNEFDSRAGKGIALKVNSVEQESENEHISDFRPSTVKEKQKALMQEIQGLERDQIEYVRGIVSELKRQNKVLKGRKSGG